MIGVDKARIKATKLKIDFDQLKVNILKMFNLKGDIKVVNGEKFYIGDQENINEKFKYINYLKITRKYPYCSLEIEFNYSRFFRRTNFELTTIQRDKETVDFNILLILSELTEMKIEKLKYNYSNLEVTEQLKIKKFTDFNNVICLLYKALYNSPEFKIKGKTYLDFSSIFKTFYTTGFTVNFKNELSGLILSTYNKSLENNDKNDLIADKVKETALRSEFKFTQTNLKTIFGTSSVESLSLDILRNKISVGIGQAIKQAVIIQLRKDLEEIEKRLDSLDKLTPKNIELFVTENNEWILDYDLFNCILKKKLIKKRSRAVIFTYRKVAKEKLIDLENSNSPKRNNSKNVKRLQQYLKNLFGIEIEIILKENGEIQVF